MKMTHVTRSLFVSIVISTFAVTPLFADNSEAKSSATTEAAEPPKLNTDVEYKTRTVYESEFLPGVRWCEEEEVDYRGDFRRVNCQDEAIIQSVSTRENDEYNAGPNSIVDDRIAPNGNLLRIKFRKKIVSTQPKSSNN